MRRENVWNYPRPPRVEPVPELIEIVFGGQIVARTREAYRVLETTHPPVYYLPPGCFTCDLIETKGRGSVCEWKGRAVYWSIKQGDLTARDCAWSYRAPHAAFAVIRDHLAVYPAAMEACFVGGETVAPQPGGFYGGWITSNLVGPFKGGPGTMGW